MRAVLLSSIATFVVLFTSNGLFHTFIAARLYDPALGGVTRPMAQANPLFVALVDVVLVVAMAVLGLGDRRVRTVRVGAIIGLVGSATYNLVNAAMIPAWPLHATVVDIAWHVALGAVGGWVMASVYGAVTRQHINR